MAFPDSGRDLQQSKALDVFRGFAAVFMIVNHAGFRLWAFPRHGDEWSAAVLLVSSFAPALFFFATGVGIGLRSFGRPGSLRTTIGKAALLVLADQLGAWSAGAWWAFDFFSFIAVSMLIVTVLSQTRRPMHNAMLLFCATILLRFVVGGSLKGVLPETGWSAAVIGVHGQQGVSYPISPWLCFPLAGFLVAKSCPLSSAAWHRAGYLSVAGAGITLALASAGASFHRWGTMGLGFFALSVPTVGAACLLAQAVQRWLTNFGALVALRGVSAFLVVPVHYAMLEVLSRWGWSDLSGPQFTLMLLPLCALSFAISKGMGRAIVRACRFEGRAMAFGLLALAAVCTAATLVLGAPGHSGAFAAATMAQFMVGFGLAKRLERHRELPSRRLV